LQPISRLKRDLTSKTRVEATFERLKQFDVVQGSCMKMQDFLIGKFVTNIPVKYTLK